MACEVLPQGVSKFFSLTKELLQRNRIKSDLQNITVESFNGNIILD